MLELRPSCEHCNASLPPASTSAMICSFECTYCAPCARDLLGNVCPNCGGGFAPRPVRPANNHKNSNYLGRFAASRDIRHRPVDLEAHASFASGLRAIAPEER